MILKFVDSSEEMKKAQSLRIEVFVKEQGIPEHLEIDEKDDVSYHAIAIEETTNEIIGTGRLTPKSDKEGTLARIAISKKARKMGIGKKIMILLEEKARSLGIQSLDLTPHKYLEKFYNSLGYTTINENEGEVAGHALIRMKKRLN